AETVDHGRVRIRANQRIGEKDFRPLTSDFRLLAQHAFRQIFQIHLMHDADSRRNELESLESLLTPLKKLVTLAIALELHVQIEFKRARRTKEIDLHRVIDNQIDRHERLDDLRVASEPLTRAGPSREV